MTENELMEFNENSINPSSEFIRDEKPKKLLIRRKEERIKPAPGLGLPEVVYVGGVRYEPVIPGQKPEKEIEHVEEIELIEQPCVDELAEVFEETSNVLSVKMPTRAQNIRNLLIVFVAFLVMVAVVTVTLDFGGKTPYEHICERFGITPVEQLVAIGGKVRSFVSTDYDSVVTVDGEEITLRNSGDTVLLEMLNDANISVGMNDIVVDGNGDEIDLSTYILQPEESARIIRVESKTYSQEEEINFESIIIPTPLLKQGDTRVMEDGANGSGLVSYNDVYHDGALFSSDVLSVEYTEEPVNEVLLVGDSSAPMSLLKDIPWASLGENGLPDDFLWRMDDAACTAYNFSGSNYGASGMRLSQGFVAVNPNVIPYGSLLYIIGDDGFTYGWAIAADTGTALLDGYVDIDCYFDYYDETLMFGKHYLDVYVVKQLTQSDLEQYKANDGMFYARIPE